MFLLWTSNQISTATQFSKPFALRFRIVQLDRKKATTKGMGHFCNYIQTQIRTLWTLKMMQVEAHPRLTCSNATAYAR